MKKQIAHFDSNESMFLQRQLDYIKTQTYDIKYAELKARKLIPVSSEADPGAEKIFYRSYDQSGIAKIIANYADDLPRASLSQAKTGLIIMSTRADSAESRSRSLGSMG